MMTSINSTSIPSVGGRLSPSSHILHKTRRFQWFLPVAKVLKKKAGRQYMRFEMYVVGNRL